VVVVVDVICRLSAGVVWCWQHVAVVDDVVTTGATAQAMSRVLRRAGAIEVEVWAVARTPRRG